MTMKTKEEILAKMLGIMPFTLNKRIIPYFLEAMQIYADQSRRELPTEAIDFMEWAYQKRWRAFADDGTTWIQVSYEGGESVCVSEVISTAQLYDLWMKSKIEG